MTALKNKCLHDRYRWSNTLNEGICIDCMAKLTVRPAPSPSQVLTAEEVLKRRFKGLESRIAYPNVYQEKVIFAAMQEYSTLQTQQLQNRVKELEGRLKTADEIMDLLKLRDAQNGTLLPFRQEQLRVAREKYNALKK